MPVLADQSSRPGMPDPGPCHPPAAIDGIHRYCARAVARVRGATNSSFARNFLAVARANLAAQAMPIAVAPLLTRLYMPEHFGVAAIFASALGVVLAFSTWRFDWSIPNARDPAEAVALFALGVCALVLTTGVTAAVILFDPGLSAIWVGYAQLGGLRALLPIAVFGAGLQAMFQGWFVRQGTLGAVGQSQINQSIAQSGLAVTGGVVGSGAVGLVAATAASAWVGIGTMMRSGRELPELVRGVTPRCLRDALSRFSTECSCSTAVSVLNMLGTITPVVLLAQFFSAQEVGWYALSIRLLNAPTAALTKALGQSFWSRAAELARAGRFNELNSLYFRTTGVLGLACVPVAVVCLAGPLFVGPVFGMDRWSGAGRVMQSLAPLIFGMVLFSPTSHLVVFGMQGMQAAADFVRLLLVCGSVLVGHALDMPFSFVVFAISVSSLLGYVGLFALHVTIHAKLIARSQR